MQLLMTSQTKQLPGSDRFATASTSVGAVANQSAARTATCHAADVAELHQSAAKVAPTQAHALPQQKKEGQEFSYSAAAAAQPASTPA